MEFIVSKKKSKIEQLQNMMNDEIQICDFIVSIPSNPEYPVLNLSHAVTIVLYELYQLQQQKSTDHFIPASIKEKDQTLNIINETIDSIEFSTKSMKQTQLNVWKRILGKSFITHREASALMGFFRKIQHYLK